MPTGNFEDANANGVDDRDEQMQNNQRSVRGVNPGAQTDSAALTQMAYGGAGFGQIMQDFFSNPGDEGDDEYRSMRRAFQLDTASKYFNSMMANYQSELNVGQTKDIMAFTNNIDRQTMQEARNHMFGLNMQTMDKQFELNDEFANRDYGRNIGMLGAMGEQTRKNYKAEGQQSRLGMITAGEQTRQNIAAEGHQSRLGTRVAGDEQRKGIAAMGVETRANIGAQGLQDRLGYKVQGDEQRKNIAATGVENRAQAITEGQQQRKNIAATGVENRLQAETEGTQKRLNIGKTAEEERETMSHADNISARRENRHQAAARASVRAM